jgi:PAS domain S-box-containing protein
LIEAVSEYAIYMLDPEGKVSTWNAGAQRLTGYRSAEILGQSYSRFFSAEDVRAHKPQRELATALSEGRFARKARAYARRHGRSGPVWC